MRFFLILQIRRTRFFFLGPLVSRGFASFAPSGRLLFCFFCSSGFARFRTVSQVSRLQGAYYLAFLELRFRAVSQVSRRQDTYYFAFSGAPVSCGFASFAPTGRLLFCFFWSSGFARFRKFRASRTSEAEKNVLGKRRLRQKKRLRKKRLRKIKCSCFRARWKTP